MGIRRLIQLPEQIWKKFHSQGLILLYHRVATLDTDPQLLSVTPEHFSRHLEYLSEYYNPISLSELQRAMEVGKIPDKSVVVTFDDGYADNFQNAKPILEKYGIPATVFVTSGYVGSEREFWWDDLERLLLLPDQLPDQLELTINGKTWNWDLTRDPEKIIKQGHETKSKSWNVTLSSDPDPQYTVYRDLHKLLKPISHEEQESILSILAEWSGVSGTGRATHRSLSLKELNQLDRGRLIEIGAHTMTHSMLSMQPEAAQKEEIIQGKLSLERMLGHQVHTFSYPYGGKIDFNKTTVKIVRKAGIDTACANYGSTFIKKVDPYRLPRVLVRDWDLQVFSYNIGKWFNE
ncbi:polysaccharide deacetylase family protein [Methanogenium sp. MK-MG]|uniref:polysaccharide deacetylase family protein n=1 Tax=Methanogenium sp. MK-MG TaxID=2599926 RepID=UPI0013ED1CC3|nr:polysaccharide deacetylase family protein [Methanogenium sp. MK-MG]KAF1075764.1 hypothetical protein MKMG_01651 [Methanogenium sp. MK-MG]